MAGTLRMQDRQPRRLFRIETPRRDEAQFAGPRLFQVFTIYIEQLRDRGRRVVVFGMTVFSNPSKTKRERVPDAGQSLGSESGDPLKAAVMCRGFELLKRIEAKLVVQPRC
jgi:hypothetical protein